MEARLSLDDWGGISLKYDKKGWLTRIDVRLMALLYLMGDKRVISVADGLDELHQDTLVSIDLLSKRLLVGMEDEMGNVFIDIDADIEDDRVCSWGSISSDDEGFDVDLKIEKECVVMVFEDVRIDISRHTDVKAVQSIKDIGAANEFLLNGLLKICEV